MRSVGPSLITLASKPEDMGSVLSSTIAMELLSLMLYIFLNGTRAYLVTLYCKLAGGDRCPFVYMGSE